MLKKAYTLLLLTIGWISLILGIVGLVVPLWPTTIFILISVFCFSESSRSLHVWTRRNKYFGKHIREWERKKRISAKGKWMASISLTFGIGNAFLFVENGVLMGTIIGSLIGIMVYLLSNETTPKRKS